MTDHLDGAGGRTKVERWVPRWMAFPPAAYTERGGVGTVRANALVAAAKLDPEPAPDPDSDPDPTGPAALAPSPDPDGRGDGEAANDAETVIETLAA